MKHLTSYLFTIGILLIAGCAEEDTNKPATDQQYFPFSVGTYQIYDVEGTRYVSQFQSEDFAYQLKTEVVDSFYTAEGVLTFVIYRSTRNNEQSEWEYLETWSARINSYEAVVNEGNISYVKLSFPAFKNKEWNGNELNNIATEDYYKIESINQPYTLDNGIKFSNCLLVNQNDYFKVDYKDERTEIYARHVGLIYRKAIQLTYCTDEDVCIIGSQEILQGTEYFQTLKEYGKN